MLLTFKSKAAADILMYEKHAKPILDLLGKDTAKGIIRGAELGAAIAILEERFSESRREDVEARERAEQEEPEDPFDKEPSKPVDVSFATRIFPLIEMLRAAQKANVDVVWGV